MREDGSKGTTRISSIPQQRFARSLPTVEFPPPLEETYSRKFMVEPPKGSVSDLQLKDFPYRLLSIIGRRTSKLKFATVQDNCRKSCRGSNRSSWRIQSTISRHPSLLPDASFQILRLWMRGSPERKRKSSRTRGPRKRFTWKSRKLKKRTDSYVEDRPPT